MSTCEELYGSQHEEPWSSPEHPTEYPLDVSSPMPSQVRDLYPAVPTPPLENHHVYGKVEPSMVKMTIQQLRESGTRLIRERYSKKHMIDYLKGLSDPVLRDKYVAFHNEHLDFDHVCAGARHHHWWIGGLEDHVIEMIGVCFDLLDLYRGDFNGKITKDDCVIACYLHDFAKIWTYELISDEDREKNPKKYSEQQLFKPVNGAFNLVDEESKTLLELSKYAIVPTEAQWSSVLFAEGGYADRNFTFGGISRTADTVMSNNPLAVITHIADMYSSQLLGGSIA